MRKRYFILSATSVSIFLAETSFACSVCGGGVAKEKLNAYVLTTGILGVLPIVLGILFFYFIRKAFRRQY